MWEYYKVTKPIDGKHGFTASNPLPTVAQFVEDVKAARANPDAFPAGMESLHLDIDNLLMPRDRLEAAMKLHKI